MLISRDVLFNRITSGLGIDCDSDTVTVLQWTTDMAIISLIMQSRPIAVYYDIGRPTM